MKLVFATGNKGKLREAREILGSAYEVISPAELGVNDDVEETGLTFKENSEIKADAIYAATGLDCFADDSGLEVDDLGGAPGIYSARYASLDGSGSDHNFENNIDRLLFELSKFPDSERRARFRCVVTLITGGEKHFFEGTLEGRIAMQRSGNGGFGYDPVFIPDLYPDNTMGDLGEEVKNKVSHRFQALSAMTQWLESRHKSCPRV